MPKKTKKQTNVGGRPVSIWGRLDHTLSVGVPSSWAKALEVLAERERRPVLDQVRYILERALIDEDLIETDS